MHLIFCQKRKGNCLLCLKASYALELENDAHKRSRLTAVLRTSRSEQSCPSSSTSDSWLDSMLVAVSFFNHYKIRSCFQQTGLELWKGKSCSCTLLLRQVHGTLWIQVPTWIEVPAADDYNFNRSTGIYAPKFTVCVQKISLTFIKRFSVSLPNFANDQLQELMSLPKLGEGAYNLRNPHGNIQT